MRDPSQARCDGTTTPARLDVEDVLIRNHDFQWGYDLELTIARLDDETVIDERYYLQPGGTRSEFAVLDPGQYIVRGVLDNRRTRTTRIDVEDGATGGLLVELGNGALSLHGGLFG